MPRKKRGKACFLLAGSDYSEFLVHLEISLTSCACRASCTSKYQKAKIENQTLLLPDILYTVFTQYSKIKKKWVDENEKVWGHVRGYILILRVNHVWRLSAKIFRIFSTQFCWIQKKFQGPEINFPNFHDFPGIFHDCRDPDKYFSIFSFPFFLLSFKGLDRSLPPYSSLWFLLFPKVQINSLSLALWIFPFSTGPVYRRARRPVLAQGGQVQGQFSSSLWRTDSEK